MRRIINFALVAVLATGALVLGQGSDASKILADARAAMGGDKLAATESLVATGRLVKFTTGAATDPADFEMAMQLPDKFFRKDVIAVLGDSTISRTSGFNGDGLIEAIDTPPGMFGGMAAGGASGPVMIRSANGVSSFGSMSAPASPEAAAASRKASVLAIKQDFARLTLGLFASSFSGYPLEFSMDAPATSADGKTSVIVVKGEGDFVAKLFIDRESHVPVMLTWMAKEPMVRNAAMRAGGPGPGGAMVVTGGGQAMTPEERAQMMKDLEAQMKEAEAKRRVVEFQMTYGDYKVVNGIKMPTRLRRTIDGKNIDELVLEKITLNAKIDPKKFDTVK
jgi:hypothetical protein